MLNQPKHVLKSKTNWSQILLCAVVYKFPELREMICENPDLAAYSSAAIVLLCRNTGFGNNLTFFLHGIEKRTLRKAHKKIEKRSIKNQKKKEKKERKAKTQ